MEKATIKNEGIYISGGLVLLMIIIHLLNLDSCYGVIPRYSEGMRGILLAPLFHSDWEHLFNNAVPLMVLSFIVFSFYRRLGYLLLTVGWLLTGLLVWAFADLGVLPSDRYVGCHIGASGIVYMLAAFVFWSGIFRRSLQLISVSLIVVFLYGSMLWGIFPEEIMRYTVDQGRISWESHLFGSIVGTLFAWTWRRSGIQKRTWDWQSKKYYSLNDEELWEEYREKYPEEFIEDEIEEPKKEFKDLF